MTHPALSFLKRHRPLHVSEAFARLESAAHDAATSPFSRNQPTAAQREASDYTMGQIELHGLRLRIENPRNTYREKVGKGGMAWRSRMAAHYGDIEGTRGNDGDPIDVFLGPFPESTAVWVVNQRRVGTDELDEHKVMLGFVSADQARAAYLDSYDRDWKGLMGLVQASVSQLKWWLQFGDKGRPFSVDQLPFEGPQTMEKVLWNQHAEPMTKPLHRLMYDLRLDDAKDGLLLDAVTMDELMTDPDIESTVTFDALVVEVGRMQQKMDLLKGVMTAAGGAVKPTEVTISDPVKSRGVLQVMVLFQMSDGQTVSVWFHNPDTTPAKLMPLDELISWKWMLNKKDVTIVVAPEKGRDLNVREVARRIMRLVERNSEAYQKANAKAVARAAESKALDEEITALEGELTSLNRQIEVAKVEAEDRADAANDFGAAALGLTWIEKMAKSGRASITALVDAKDSGKVYVIVGSNATGKHQVRVASAYDDQFSIYNSNPMSLGKAKAAAVELAKIIMEDANQKASEREDYAAQVAEITSADGYFKVWSGGGNKELQEKWQDVLHAHFQARLVDVRNALRALGWDGPKFGEISRNGAMLQPEFEKAGAGGNVVGIIYKVVGNVKPGDAALRDDLSVTPDEIAAELNMMVALPEPGGQEGDQQAGEATAVQRVDAAYKFADATDDFKEWIADTVGKEDYSTFATSRNMDRRVHEFGGTVAWSVTQAVALDDAGEGEGEEWGTVKGEIRRDGEILGRAYVAADGKAMVYVGAGGKQRVKFDSGTTAMWSDDDAVYMVEAIFTVPQGAPDVRPAVDPVEPDPKPDPQPEPEVTNVEPVEQTWHSKYLVQGWNDRWRVTAHNFNPLSPSYPTKEEAEAAAAAYFAGASDFPAPSDAAAQIAPVAPAVKGDISYRAVDDMFTSFYPDSEAGEGAWNVINATEGSEGGKVLTQHAASVIEQLRAAGYTVTEAAPITESEDDLLAALNEPAADPELAADKAYLESLLDGSTDLIDPAVFERLEPMFAKYENDADMMDLLVKSANAYGDAAVAAAQTALAA